MGNLFNLNRSTLSSLALFTICMGYSLPASALQCRLEDRNVTMAPLLSSQITGKKYIVAHRGLLANTEARIRYAENSERAVWNAICNGYPLVEIDIKSLKDGSVIIMHDSSSSRTTNVAPITPDGKYILQRDGIISTPNGITRARRYTSKLLDTYTRGEFLSEYRADNIFTNKGKYVESRINPNKSLIFLKDFIASTMSVDSDYYRRGMFVLDIQDIALLKRAYKIVKDLNAFDRVIFKVWSTAVPVRQNGPADSAGRKKFILDVGFTQGSPLQGYWVVSSSTITTTASGDMSFYLTTSSTYINTPADSTTSGKFIALPYSTDPALARFNANGVLGDFRSRATSAVVHTGTSPWMHLLGLEAFISAVPVDGAKDNYVTNRWANRFSNSVPGPLTYEKRWGVVRGVDYLQDTCSGSAEYSCAKFPNGKYNTGTDTLTLVPDAVRNARNTFGKLGDVLVTDID